MDSLHEVLLSPTFPLQQCCKTESFSPSSCCAVVSSPDPPQVGQGSTWLPVVVMVIVMSPPHRQNLAINQPSG